MLRNPFVELMKVDVGDHIEKKNGLAYLSWAWAETEIKQRFPLTTFEVLENPDARPIPVRIPQYEGTETITDNYGKKKEVRHVVGYKDGEIMDRRLWPTMTGATVRTRVTLKWYDRFEDNSPLELFSIVTEDQLPIMTPSNKAIALEDIDAMNLNKTIQRSMTKAIAMQGLGMYIYAGEDLPEQLSADEKEEAAALKAKLDKLCPAMKKLPADELAVAREKFVEIIGDGKGIYKSCNDIAKLTEAVEYLTKVTTK